MKYYALAEGSELPPEDLSSEYSQAKEIGVIRLGTTCFFFRQRRKIYYLPYSSIRRCFRRVMLVPARMPGGDLHVENLVICTDAGEAAQIQLPGEQSGKEIIEELKALVPDAQFTCPSSDDSETH